MTMIPPSLLPEGLSDRLPPQAEASARLARRVLDTVATHGYERVMPPLAEFEDTLTQRLKSMRAQDLVRAVDPVSQRSLALRPDMTAQVGRIAATRLAAAPRPLRLSYAGPVIRLKANQLRPEREKLQVGAELIGTDSVAAAVEIVNVAIEALQAAGELEAVRTELDAKDAGALVALGPQAAAYLPLIEATGPFHAAMERLEAFNASLGGAIDSRIAGLRAIAKPIGWDITLTLDPTERHGFEYQNWFGFSIFAEGFIGEIGRGGSYAILRADGEEEPAIGFSLYPDPLIDAGFGDKAPRRLFLPLGADAARAAELRAEGWHTVAALVGDEDGATLRCSHWLDGAELRAF